MPNQVLNGRTRLLPLLAGLLSLPLAAGAAPATSDLADLSLEELKAAQVSYAPAQSEKKTVELPGTATILTSTEIKVGGFRTLDDLLNYVRGFYVTSDRNYSYLGLRGFGSLGGYNSRVLLMVDGHRVNDNVYGQFYTGRGAIVDMEMVDHVEIIRGPASVQYGSNAVFGVINVVTKRGRDVKGTVLSAQGGTGAAFGGGFILGGEDGDGLQWALQGSAFGSRGNDALYFPEYDDPSTNDGVAEDRDGLTSQHAFFSLGREGWSLRGAMMHRFKRDPTGIYDTAFNDPGTSTEDLTLFAEGGFESGDPESGLWTGRLFLDLSHYTGSYVAAGTGVANIDIGNGAWWGTELRYVRSTARLGKFTFGAEFVHDFEEFQKNYDADDPGNPYLDDSRDSYQIALYVQDEIKLAPELQLTLGGRFDHFSQSGSQWIPRGALLWAPVQDTVFKLVAGKGFRAPSPYELYFEDNGYSQLPNPDLEPEVFETYEFDWEQTLAPGHRTIFSLFRYVGVGLIVPDVDTLTSLDIYRNIGAASVNGLEFEYQYHDEGGVQGRLSWAHQLAQDDTTEEVLPEAPQNLGKASLLVPVDPERLFVSGEVQFTDRSLGTGGFWAEGYAVANLKLYFPRFLVEGLEANLAAYNLFDARYAHPASNSHLQETIPQDGLVIWSSLRWRP